ncbi:hypothetical protein V2J09_010720 [Rumex salicifolius]
MKTLHRQMNLVILVIMSLVVALLISNEVNAQQTYEQCRKRCEFGCLQFPSEQQRICLGKCLSACASRTVPPARRQSSPTVTLDSNYVG